MQVRPHLATKYVQYSSGFHPRLYHATRIFSASRILPSSHSRDFHRNNSSSAYEMGGRTVLVTGATGLLGRQVCQAFERAEWQVRGTAYSRADGSSILKADLQDAAEIERVLKDARYASLATVQLRGELKRY
jgi:hypothetical protein